MTEHPSEIDTEFSQAGFPPLPRSEISYLEDAFNFKKAIISPIEPFEYLKGDDGKTYKVPCYTSTMALGNLSTNEVGAERDDWRIIRILTRYGYNDIVAQQYLAITDRVIATQSHQATMLAAVTVQQYGMRRIESLGRHAGDTDDESGSPFSKIMTAIKGKGGSANGEDLKSRSNDTMSRYRV